MIYHVSLNSFAALEYRKLVWNFIVVEVSAIYFAI